MHKLSKIKNALLCGLLMLTGFTNGAHANKIVDGEAGTGLPPWNGNNQQQKEISPNLNLTGTWRGVLAVGSANLRLILNIAQLADGSYKATLDSLDQDARGIPVDSVVVKDANVRLELKAIGGIYEGILNPERTTIIGNWTQGGTSKLTLTFQRSDKAFAAPNRPQEPKKPYPYDEQEVSYENQRGGARLNGTLTLPRNKGQHPAVLLITGSGMQDRDETVAGHRPFLILADYLTRCGIAVLRVDDRGWGKSPAAFVKATSVDFADDVLAGVKFLKTRREINAKQIGLIGHSEGGMIAPLAAAKSPDVAFIVLMAGPGLPGEELLGLQSVRLLKASGASDTVIAQTRAIQQLMFTILRQEKTDAAVEQRFRAEVSKMLGQMSEEQKRAMGINETALENQIKLMMTPWYRYIIAYDPRPTLMKVNIPVLAINGERDLQVPAKENLLAIAAALKAGGNRDFTTLEMPQLNHLFQTSQTGSPIEYSQIEETMSLVALKTISHWILQHASVQYQQ